MTLAIKHVKTYLRLGLAASVLVVAVVILWMNRNHEAKVWFFGLTDPAKPINVVWLILSTVFATRTAQWLLSFTRGMWRDMRAMKAAREEQLAKEAQARREAELTARERRIEEMLKQGVVPETSEPALDRPRKTDQEGSGEGK
jgi:hypothetical protein